MPHDYRHQPAQRSRDEHDTQVINDIFRSPAPTTTTNHFTEGRRTGSPNLQRDPHLLSAVRDSVHFGPSTTTSQSTQQQQGTMMQGRTSPFDDKYADTTTERPAGKTGNQLGDIIHASSESSGVVGKERIRFDRSG